MQFPNSDNDHASWVPIAGLRPVADDNYRYKRPPTETTSEGRNQMGRTVITNAAAIAAALHRPPEELAKLFSLAFNAKAAFDADRGSVSIKGAYSARQLDEALAAYEEHFVLCVNCRYAEVPRLRVKRGQLERRCASCGHRGPVGEWGRVGDKLARWVVKSASASASGGGSKSSKSETRAERKARKAAKKAKKAAKQARDQELPAAAPAPAPQPAPQPQPDDDDGEEDEIKEPDDDEAARIRGLVLGLESPAAAAEPALTAALNQLVGDQDSLMRHCIAAAEELCGAARPEIMPSFPIVLKHLYDADVLEEATLLRWAAEGASSFTTVDDATAERLRAAAEPLVAWLEASGSSSDSDGEDN